MPRALISVYDKKGIVEFAQELAALGYEIISTGGTYKLLQEAGIKVIKVSEVTGFPEILEGRVKTLHPKIHGGILARGTQEHLEQLQEHDIELIDLVAVNLYPFEKTISKPGVTLDEALENIDIGGPTMVRASAKNFPRITVVVNPNRYTDTIKMLKDKGETTLEFRRQLAAEAFAHTAEYDSIIAGYLNSSQTTGTVPLACFPHHFIISGTDGKSLRYGENPHQRANIYTMDKEGKGLADIIPIQGKPLSYNNYLDTHAAWGLTEEFDSPAAVIVKHNNPCGAAIGDNLLAAYKKALECDPVSAFGGIVAFNRTIDAKLADELVKMFYEVIAAPDFSAESLKILAAKPNLRLLSTKGLSGESVEIKSIGKSILIQDYDKRVEEYPLEAVTNKHPDKEQIANLIFANRVAKWVKSNAIVIVKNGAALGMGAGQMNRVGSAKIALEQAGEKAKGAVLASDAFLPFADTVELAANYGIEAIIQPGGSLKDEEVIKKCNELGIAMVFTGIRHFKH
ncbi:bifunctional phosphoribosylaminoimidazolecarboxamide formyltransferase/IMP cyclohydrolase [Desulfitibacter alkalitolerans]|uniref:bifunctional phosphoribosylaminoimidazolecarboxamide formyltransferase/IMP cyclohydrolase n=1 Tax=Desulfitibacter alkalitolerans TaxID=264641 RepID=UPI000486273C|nr:bifunctional phosphoribosylaminoimidazolecarboxamide formyltransferase/IMP cyclohydrolase [Desulfitibacter alkalitolerans]